MFHGANDRVRILVLFGRADTVEICLFFFCSVEDGEMDNNNARQHAASCTRRVCNNRKTALVTFRFSEEFHPSGNDNCNIKSRSTCRTTTPLSPQLRELKALCGVVCV